MKLTSKPTLKVFRTLHKIFWEVTYNQIKGLLNVRHGGLMVRKYDLESFGRK